ncbi:MAG: sodium:proton antiporter, partial [Ignavibacteriaceae bacterium]
MNSKLKFLFLILVVISFFLINDLHAASNSITMDSLAVSKGEQAIEFEHDLPTPLMVIPFAILLLMIATGPLFYKHFWEHNYPKVAIALSVISVVYYLVVLKNSHVLLHTLAEYLSFIALLSSLFVASGGILIKVDKKSTPMLNVLFLLFGAVISNIIGTTGASMLLIRPFIKMNRNRISAYHIIFFIFVVSNIGGALTPIGDPPLFLGFLRGVPFFWVIENVWFIWLPTIFLILAVFFVIDSLNKKDSNPETTYTGKFEFKGGKNLIYLLIIIISVFIDPAVISWVPSLAPIPFGIREIIMFAVVYLSYKTADTEILKANEFDLPNSVETSLGY